MLDVGWGVAIPACFSRPLILHRAGKTAPSYAVFLTIQTKKGKNMSNDTNTAKKGFLYGFTGIVGGCAGCSVIFFVLLVIVAIVSPKPERNGQPGAQRTAKSTITLADFNRIQVGMTFEQVESIVGSDYELLSENQIADIHTALYSWKDSSFMGGNMNVTFQNGQVVSKAQFGLK